MTSRKQRPGENWFRGHDLPDGKLNKKTFRNIINAIVKNELQDISKTSKSIPHVSSLPPTSGID